MLGKLFNLTSGSAATSASAQSNQPPTNVSPESIQEDIHTRNLLFPDTQTLYSRQDQVFPLSTTAALTSSSPSNFDYDGEVDLDVRDVRVIVMQDSLGTVNPCILYDSHPAPPVPPTETRQSPGASHTQTFVKDFRRNPATSRKTSLSYSRPMVIQPDSPQPRQGAFDRRPSFQVRTFTSAENEAQRTAREYREELSSFTSCISANTEVMSYKGTSTKVHIVPSDSRPDVSSSFAGDGKGSMGRSSLRSSRLSQSFTAESASAAFSSVTASSRLKDRKKILVTRLFPVNLPNDDPETPGNGVTPHSRLSEDGGSFPFPSSLDESGIKKKKPQPKQKRTPMYAVALVLQLPTSPAQQPPSAAKQSFRGPNSYTDQDSFPSSFGSARRSGWTLVGAGCGSDSIDSIYRDEVEDKMDAITQHWDIIMRTLTHLQSVVATTLFPMLKQADHIAPDPHQPSIAAQVARSSSINGRRGSNASQIQTKLPKTNAKLISLPPNCLMNKQQIGHEIDTARVRIVTGLRATRVVTGQGRWGPWREEARWVAKYAGGKEQGFFFLNLLTGFLATHTDWLQALSPVWYRRRHYQQQKAKNEEDTSLPARTIIISSDKMAARRMVFLLSAFLPTNQQLPTVRPQPRNTSASFSHSPPSFIIPILKEESLRRRIKRQPSAPIGASHQRSFSIQSQATTRSAIGTPPQLDHLSMDALRSRRPSDTTLFKPTALSSHGSDATTRKSSAATTNTIVPDAAIPHFTSIHKTNTRQSNRPGSSGSMAADDLKRTLRRGDSAGQSSTASTESHRRSSNWGSVISGLWSARRRESSASTIHTLDFPMNRGNPPNSPVRLSARDKLSEMVSEECAVEALTKEFKSPHGPVQTEMEQPDHPRTLERRGQAGQDIVKRTPDPLGAFESPVKTSISADDGVIDVDVPFPDYLVSFNESAISSPSSSGYLSTPEFGAGGVDSFEQFSRVDVGGDAPLNVAGWLQQFHPDFVLQGIPPQPDLLEKIKESLKAEPTPLYHAHQLPVEWPTEQWVDVSSAIIADTTTFTIKRLRFRRLVKPKLLPDRSGGHAHSSSTNPYSSSLMTPALSPYEQPLKESIEEEVLFTWDEALIEAVEKVTAHVMLGSQDSSTTNSSRSVSKRRERSDSDASEPELPKPIVSQLDTQEVPRAECKTVVLSALGSIVQEVVDQRVKEGHTPGSKVAYETQREKESVLRGAVRMWLENVELGEGS